MSQTVRFDEKDLYVLTKRFDTTGFLNRPSHDPEQNDRSWFESNLKRVIKRYTGTGFVDEQGNPNPEIEELLVPLRDPEVIFHNGFHPDVTQSRDERDVAFYIKGKQVTKVIKSAFFKTNFVLEKSSLKELDEFMREHLNLARPTEEDVPTYDQILPAEEGTVLSDLTTQEDYEKVAAFANEQGLDPEAIVLLARVYPYREGPGMLYVFDGNDKEVNGIKVSQGKFTYHILYSLPVLDVIETQSYSGPLEPEDVDDYTVLTARTMSLTEPLLDQLLDPKVFAGVKAYNPEGAGN